jgi:hypothetical protein
LLVHPRPTLLTSPLHAGNKIGDAGAAAVASALEPRRNGDGSWTPSTALTELRLDGEWVLSLMIVTFFKPGFLYEIPPQPHE